MNSSEDMPLEKRMIDFDAYPGISFEKIFEMYGKDMIKIKISDKHVTNTELNRSKFDEILHQIRTHCTVGLLKHVDIRLCRSCTIINEAILNNALPVLKNIESFQIMESRLNPPNFQFDRRYLVNDSVNKFIDRVIKNALNIRSAKFRNLRINGDWLFNYHMQNVETLSFENCSLSKSGCLIAFMQRKPALSSFTWVNSSVDRAFDSANFVLNLIGDNVPNLKVLNFKKHDGYFENNVYVVNGNEPQLKNHFLAKLTNLKELTCIFTMADQFHSEFDVENLRILAEQNSIEKLSISMFGCHREREDDGYGLDMSYLHCFTSLKCVEISDLSNICNLFLLNFFHYLPNLKECCLTDNDCILPAHAKYIVKCSKELTILKLRGLSFRFEYSSYSDLLKIRKETSNETLLVFIEKSPLDTFIEHLDREYQPDYVKLLPFV